MQKFFAHNRFSFEEHFLNVKLIENINSEKNGPVFSAENKVDHVRGIRDKIAEKKFLSCFRLFLLCHVCFVCATFLPPKST